MMDKLPITILDSIKAVDEKRIDHDLRQSLARLNRKIVVLDDDPTGVQTVHGISVYTDWSMDSFRAGFAEANSLFFILTNSRGLTRAETVQIHTDIGATLAAVAAETGKDYILIIRTE